MILVAAAFAVDWEVNEVADNYKQDTIGLIQVNQLVVLECLIFYYVGAAND